MKVALLQIGYGDDETVADRVDRVAALVREQRGHDLVVLPELWAPGGFAYETWETRADTPHGAIATAMSVVNAIPAVCAAPPGVLTILDLPFFPCKKGH